ncbi:hypothetical protein [Ferrimonas lipolytica]|uniref:Uncharacterized protein n=1 Tax=Ferrimonas lipolytica TaxID=2724191 RepID=A0A6H1UGY6_9GAMM|nr:hypothetical protein [Ferrimonas lipolytica]QIZ77476.1 hypothetical protein HER31_11610 [Ferrimonas lipolytica]
MKNYERGFTLNYDNKNINMFGCEDSLDMMKFEADILQTLNWNITDEISISNVEEYCHSLAPRIVADTDYIEEMKLLSY